MRSPAAPRPPARRGASARRVRGALLVAACVLVLVPGARAADEAGRRARMVEEVEAMARATADATGRERFAPRVMAALSDVPRHRFVPDAVASRAYANRPLPIGHGQTISQPYIVALMTDLLDLEPEDRVLEVGTGSAYQAAILAELTAEVHSIEIIEPLASSARERLAALGYDHVRVHHGDGYFGHEAAAPFDAVVVTAAAGHVPPPLVAQLAPGGAMVIPVGSPFAVQHLLLVRKDGDGAVSVRNVLPVRFVPLTGSR